MKKLFIIFAGLFLLSSSLFCQSLEDVCKIISANPVTKGDYTQVKTVKSGKSTRSLKSSGTFIFCTEGIMWNNLKPRNTTVIIGKDFMAQISATGKKTVTDNSENQSFITIASAVSSFFSNDYQALTQSFDSEISGDEAGTKIALTPTDSTIQVALSAIEIILKDKDITAITITDASGNTTAYTFTNHTYPEELSQDEKALFAN